MTVLTDKEGLPGQYWLPLFIERLDSNPKKWNSFGEWMLGGVRGENIADYLKQIASNKNLSPHVRISVLTTLALQPEIQQDNEAIEMVRDALQDDEFSLQLLAKMNFERLDLFPEQIELLLHKDDQIRLQANQFLMYHSPRIAQGPIILDALLRALDDTGSRTDRTQAIFAIGSLRDYFGANSDRRRKVVDKLGKMLMTEDGELLPELLDSMSSILGNDTEGLVKRTIDTQGTKMTQKRAEELKEALPKAKEISKLRTPPETGGRGGMGGGGMSGGMSGGGMSGGGTSGGGMF